MNALEGRVFVVDMVTARRAVRLVADDEADLIHPILLLGLTHDFDRLVRGEDDGHAAALTRLLHFSRKLLRLRRRGVREFASDGERLDVLKIRLAGRRVGTHGERIDLKFALLLPVGERLRKQRKRGHEEHDEAALPFHRLGDLHRGEGLPGPAGHDELAAVARLEAGQNVLDGVFLVLARDALRPCFDLAAFGIDAPVDHRGRKIPPSDERDGDRLRVEFLHHVFRPLFVGRDEQAMREVSLRGGREEGIDFGLRHAVLAPVELALDRREAVPVRIRRYEIDPVVLGVDGIPRIFCGPVLPGLDLREEIRVRGLLHEPVANQRFKARPLVPRGERRRFDRRQKRRERRGVVE